MNTFCQSIGHLFPDLVIFLFMTKKISAFRVIRWSSEAVRPLALESITMLEIS